MTGFLFCGGSHLSDAKPALLDFVAEAHPNARTRFCITAGPFNRDWAAQGGRYEVDGTRITRKGGRRDLTLDLADYDVIVFAGQWILPDPLFRAGFDWTQPLSDTLLDEVFRRHIERPFMATQSGAVYFANEPLTLFNTLRPGRVILAADPPPRLPGYRNAPITVKQHFYRSLQGYCDDTRIRLLPLPEQALDEALSLRDVLFKTADDLTHAKPDYWKMVLQGGLREAVSAVLDAHADAPVSA